MSSESASPSEITTPAEIAEFIAFWRDSTLKERSGAQGHFIALCRLLEIKRLSKNSIS